MPPAEMFSPNQMSVRKRTDFVEKWYPAQIGKVYDFRKELEGYCRSDVAILAKAVETYMLTQIRHKPMDPWSRITIAGYA